MLKTNVYDMSGKLVGEIELSEAVFGITPNESVVHDVVKNHLANKRQGTQSALTRAEVSGGGRKPWRQKGTGRARQGSTRAPQWTHGGVALGPKPRTYKVKMNKKIRRAAMFSALSSKVADNDMIVIDAITADEYKTKTMVKMLEAVGAGKKSLVVLPEVDSKVIKSLSNIEGVKVTQSGTINVYDVLNCDSLIAAKAAVEKIEEVYAK